MEQNENINVSDVSEGKVKIRYNGKLVRLAHRCSDCGTVFSPVNSDVFDDDLIIDLSNSTNYVATRLI